MKFISLVSYVVLIGKKDSGTRSIEVVYIEADNYQDAVTKIFKRKPYTYKNTAGIIVSQQLMEIFETISLKDIPKLAQEDSDLMGIFIKKPELFGKESLIKPKLPYLLGNRRGKKLIRPTR